MNRLGSNSLHPWFGPAMNDDRLGTAEWVPPKDAGLVKLQPGQFLLGFHERKPVGIKEDRHILICGGTRGGKGVSLVVPNLCLWRGSAVIIDPKGENAMVTARRRADGSRYCTGLGQKVCILDPFNAVKTNTDDFADLKGGFNPVDAIMKSDEPVELAALIADAFSTGQNQSDPFWEDAARQLIMALILHVASGMDFLPQERNLLTVRDLLMAGDIRTSALAALNGDDGGSAFALLAKAMKRNRSYGGVIARCGATLEEWLSSDKLRISILQVARTNTDFMDSPGARRCLARSTFALADLKTDPVGFTLYLSLPQRHMDTQVRWLRMMTNLLLGEMDRVRHKPANGHLVMMLLDEFPALKRMRSIENAAAQIAGNSVQMIFVTQTLAQIKDIYHDNWETFVANAGVKLFFSNDDHFTRDYVSKLIGEREIIRRTENFSQTISKGSSWSSSSSLNVTRGYSLSGPSSSVSETSGSTSGYNSSRSVTRGYSESIHKRPLVSPDEVGRLFGKAERPLALVLVSGEQPCAVDRLPYHREDVLAGTYDPHPDHPLPLTLDRLAIKRTEDRKRAEAARVRAAEEHAREQKALKIKRDWEICCQIQRQEEADRNEWRQQWKDRLLRGFVTVVLYVGVLYAVRVICTRSFL